jgi:hypothetical protein
MKQIDLIYRTMVAELGQRLMDATFTADFPVEGRFVPVRVKERVYWYFDAPDEKRRYVGPADDAEISRRVEAFKEIKDDTRARRRIVSTLTRDAGLPAPERFSGEIVEALARAGIFRLRAVLVGSVAFSAYAGLLGMRLPQAVMMTGDADFAQDFAISSEVGDSLPPILDILQAVDPTFRAIPHRSGSPRSTSFINSTSYQVEFLTGNRGSDDHTGRPAPMPALGGVSAEPLRFLDFLIYEPVRAVMLHKAGISVVVPDPARYAVHKLIVGSRRIMDTVGAAKREKDLKQAAILFEALPLARREDDLAQAFQEAWERGEAWRQALRAGIAAVQPGEKAIFVETVKAFGIALHDG